MDSAVATMNENGGSVPSIASITNTMNDVGGYNVGQNAAQQEQGAYLVQNTLAKLQMMPPQELGDEETAMKVYGSLKLAAIDGDGAAIRSILEENGGDTMGLSDQALVDTWGVNEHEGLHEIIFGNLDQVANAVHMTSLNRDDGMNAPIGEPGTVGGFNDKGQFPQWGWFESAQNMNDVFAS